MLHKNPTILRLKYTANKQPKPGNSTLKFIDFIATSDDSKHCNIAKIAIPTTMILGKKYTSTSPKPKTTINKNPAINKEIILLILLDITNLLTLFFVHIYIVTKH